ncbi:neuropeptide CCHamide-1 isoform X2 [Manduca sexta]|uniref:neuropeptide CCHamide-1 isoform X2 n=1 Tax=Manduca sexta TaxID=7130 RepID=UPI00188F2822|nr:neuropeptide CCHamide-1 isoform X2 [Manduca sexta]
MNKACKASTHSATATRLFALLLVICLAECVTGSCLSYGHSCWGAHGKRSGKPPAAAPDWYLTRILRRMAANAEMNRVQPEESKYDDLNAIFQVDVADDTPATDRLLAVSGERPMELPFSKSLDAKPMIDDEVLSKMKIWQMMREAPEDK